jgi:act minimal PKS acyl carrier protein
MSIFTLDDLRALMRDVMWLDEPAELDADMSDTAFPELGYDSLAVLELAIHVQRVHGVTISDNAVMESTTPRALVTLVNAHFTEAGV